MSSPKTPPGQNQKNQNPFNIFRGLTRKQKKVVNVAVLGGRNVGKSGKYFEILTFGVLLNASYIRLTCHWQK